MATQLDHIVPLEQGGKDFDQDPDNAQGLCDQCHVDKSNEDQGHKVRSPSDELGMPIDPAHHWNRGG